MSVSVADVADEQSYLPALECAGYVLRVREPGHRMVRTPDLSVHVHICTVDSTWELRDLLFRDWLRRNDADRTAYAQLKRRLARRDWPDMNAYSDAKSGLIGAIMARAWAWAAESGWRPPPRR